MARIFLFDSMMLDDFEKPTGKTFLGFPVKEYFYTCKQGNLGALQQSFQGTSIMFGFMAALRTKSIQVPFNEHKWM